MDLLGNVRELSVGKTVIMVSHRLQGISRADKIFFMDKGSIAEQGTHEELMTLKGLYYNAFQANQA
jgi:ABC-type multidrug transport system fused ATPase/permease subunit